MVTRTQVSMSDFWAFVENVDDDRQYELIAGEIVVSPAPLLPHQRLSKRLLLLLESLIPDGETWIAPTQVQIDESNSYQPDLFWIAEDSNSVQTPAQIIGAPDLVVEILSPSTAKHDKEIKFNAYEKAGVREYWIADPVHLIVEVWVSEAGHFDRIGAFTDGDTFPSKALGKTVTFDGIFEHLG